MSVEHLPWLLFPIAYITYTAFAINYWLVYFDDQLLEKRYNHITLYTLIFFCLYYSCSLLYLYDLILPDYSLEALDPIIACIDQIVLHGIFQTLVWRFWMVHYQNEYNALTRDKNWIGVITGNMDEETWQLDFFHRRRNTLGNKHYTRMLFFRVFALSCCVTVTQYACYGAYLLIDSSSDSATSRVLQIASGGAWLVSIFLFVSAIFCLVGIILNMSKFEDKLRFVNEFQGLRCFAPFFSVCMFCLGLAIVFMRGASDRNDAELLVMFYILFEVCVGLMGCAFVGQMSFYVIKLLVDDGLIEPQLNELRILSLNDAHLREVLVPCPCLRNVSCCASCLVPLRVQLYHRLCCNLGCVCCKCQMRRRAIHNYNSSGSQAHFMALTPDLLVRGSGGDESQQMQKNAGGRSHSSRSSRASRGSRGSRASSVASPSKGEKVRVSVYGRDRKVTVGENDFWFFIYWDDDRFRQDIRFFYTLSVILSDRECVFLFMSYLQQMKAPESLLFLLEVIQFKREIAQIMVRNEQEAQQHAADSNIVLPASDDVDQERELTRTDSTNRAVGSKAVHAMHPLQNKGSITPYDDGGTPDTHKSRSNTSNASNVSNVGASDAHFDIIDAMGPIDETKILPKQEITPRRTQSLKLSKNADNAGNGSDSDDSQNGRKRKRNGNNRNHGNVAFDNRNHSVARADSVEAGDRVGATNAVHPVDASPRPRQDSDAQYDMNLEQLDRIQMQHVQTHQMQQTQSHEPVASDYYSASDDEEDIVGPPPGRMSIDTTSARPESKDASEDAKNGANDQKWNKTHKIGKIGKNGKKNGREEKKKRLIRIRSKKSGRNGSGGGNGNKSIGRDGRDARDMARNTGDNGMGPLGPVGANSGNGAKNGSASGGGAGKKPAKADPVFGIALPYDLPRSCIVYAQDVPQMVRKESFDLEGRRHVRDVSNDAGMTQSEWNDYQRLLRLVPNVNNNLDQKMFKWKHRARRLYFKYIDSYESGMHEINISGELRGHYFKVFDNLEHLMIVNEMDPHLLALNMEMKQNSVGGNVDMQNIQNMRNQNNTMSNLTYSKHYKGDRSHDLTGSYRVSMNSATGGTLPGTDWAGKSIDYRVTQIYEWSDLHCIFDECVRKTRPYLETHFRHWKAEEPNVLKQIIKRIAEPPAKKRYVEMVEKELKKHKM